MSGKQERLEDKPDGVLMIEHYNAIIAGDTETKAAIEREMCRREWELDERPGEPPNWTFRGKAEE